MLLLILAAAASYAYEFAPTIADFRERRSRKSIAGRYSRERLLVLFHVAGPEMIHATRQPTMIALVLCGALAALWRGRDRARQPGSWARAISGLPRGIVVLALWTVFGIAVIGSLNYRPTRYMLFLDYPLIVLGCYAAVRLLPRRSGPAVTLALVAMLAYQAHLFERWAPDGRQALQADGLPGRDGAHRRRRASRHHPGAWPGGSRTGAALEPDHAPGRSGFVPVSRYSLCQRLAYWKPLFYVRLQEDATSEEAALSSCPQVAGKRGTGALPGPWRLQGRFRALPPLAAVRLIGAGDQTGGGLRSAKPLWCQYG